MSSGPNSSINERVVSDASKSISFDSEFKELISLCKEIIRARFSKEKESFFSRNQEWVSVTNFEQEYKNANNPSKFFQSFTEWADEMNLTSNKVFDTDNWVEDPKSVIYLVTKRIQARRKLSPEQARELRTSYNINLSKIYDHARFFTPTMNFGTKTLENRKQAEFSDRLRLQLLRVMLVICDSGSKAHYISELNGIYADLGESSPFEKKTPDILGVAGSMIRGIGENVPELKPLIEQVDPESFGEQFMTLLKSEEAKETLTNAVASFKENKIQNIAMGIVRQATNPNAKTDAVTSEEATAEVVRIAQPMLRKLNLIPQETNDKKEDSGSLEDFESQLE